ncbi:MAG: hypothetical protein ACE5QV_02785 [Fidelibacterota bacterium]
MAKRRLNFIEDCRYCKAKTKMELVGENLEKDILWFRCSKCHQVFSFTRSDLITDPPAAADLSGINPESPESDFVLYAPDKTFTVGQALYHKTFNDYGRVLKKEVLSNGRSAIVVSFSKSGTKKLIESK